MSRPAERKRDVQKVTDIVRDAGGRIVGRTRLQKVSYFLELAGWGEGFSFQYRYYGPYSEDLAAAVRNARILGLLEEEEKSTAWGGSYSIFTSSSRANFAAPRHGFAKEALSADPVELELAATAAFLSVEGHNDPWGETANRKPEKTQGNRLENAKALYRRLQRIETPRSLPQIA